MTEVDNNAKIIWDYMLMHHELKSADAILVFGSHDTRPAVWAAELYKRGLAQVVVFSGGYGSRASAEHFDRPEAEVFAEVAIEHGVPAEKILLEKDATNSGENVLFCKKVLEEAGIPTERFIVVQKPYMERRTLAIFKKLWLEPEVVMSSPEISFEEYNGDEKLRDRFLNALVGDLQRIKEYPARGFQIPQEIPDDVWQAYEKLVALGYTKQLIV
jgi:uncharacterized SAM-binding protein YcdF (DUF218 family)